MPADNVFLLEVCQLTREKTCKKYGGRINSGLAILVPIFLSISASVQKVTGSLQKVTGMPRRPGKML